MLISGQYSVDSESAAQAGAACNAAASSKVRRPLFRRRSNARNRFPRLATDGRQVYGGHQPGPLPCGLTGEGASGAEG